jgi:hypothetical protein
VGNYRLLFTSHIFIAPRHFCTHCGETFKSRPNISDLLLMLLFAGLMAFFGKLWWLSTIFLLAWLLMAFKLRKEGHAATEVHTIFAGTFLATLWIIALAAKTDVFSKRSNGDDVSWLFYFDVVHCEWGLFWLFPELLGLALSSRIDPNK